MTGSGKDGGSQTTNSEMNSRNEVSYTYKDFLKDYLPKGVQPIATESWKTVLGNLGQGLTPAEKANYIGSGVAGINKTYETTEKQIPELLAQSGVSANEGPALDMKKYLTLNKTKSMADMLANLGSADLTKKNQNLATSLQTVYQNYNTPVASTHSTGTQTGQSTTQTEGPSGGGGFGDILGGVLGGGGAGAALGRALTPAKEAVSPWYAVGGALLGGAGKALR
jgi:hypothetical protein